MAEGHDWEMTRHLNEIERPKNREIEETARKYERMKPQEDQQRIIAGIVIAVSVITAVSFLGFILFLFL